MYAMGKGPIRRLDGIHLAKGIHGFQRVQLLKNVIPNPVFPPDTQTITIHNDKVSYYIEDFGNEKFAFNILLLRR